MIYRVCINTSNLHYGGGVQVATSFLRELIKLKEILYGLDVSIFVSSEVAQNLDCSLMDLERMFNVEKFDVFGLGALSPKIRTRFKQFDLIFSVFGPDYLPLINVKRVVGFAQSWILYDSNEVYKNLSLISTVKSKLTFWLKKQFFKGADAYIVELEHVKEGMLVKGLAYDDNIHIAYNSVSNNYLSFELENLLFDRKINREPFRIGIISRNYPHKNLSIFPEVKRILEMRYKRSIECFVTFSYDQFMSESPTFQKDIINLGPQKIDECIKTYLKFDAVFFPSLLECFSATPLEALATGRVLFASDRPFNRDVCGEHAYYFDPLNPEDAARVINDYIENKWGRDLEERLVAREHAINFSNPRDRALKYIEVINKVLS